jgi:hypothetical protein
VSGPTIAAGGDPVLRRAMFALELVDPVTGLAVGETLQAGATIAASAETLRAPGVTSTGQLVWFDFDPPAERWVTVNALAPRKDFAPFAETINVKARQKNVPAKVERRMLVPTGSYRPPAGRLAAAGMLIDDEAADKRNPIAGAEVVLVLDADTLGAPIRSTLAAVTDQRGGFVAVAVGLGTQVPQPAPRPAPDGSATGRLEVTWQNQTLKAPVTLRLAQLNYLPEPLAWADLTP